MMFTLQVGSIFIDDCPYLRNLNTGFQIGVGNDSMKKFVEQKKVLVY